MLEAQNLSCGSENFALFKQINFKLRPRETIHIHGANGSGKSTLLRTLCGYIPPINGDVCWHKKNIKSANTYYSYRRAIAYLGHKQALHDHASVAENLMWFAQMRGLSIGDENLAQILNQLEITNLKQCECRALSWGQRQRVQLARLCMSQSPLWLLDEPFSGLDQQARGIFSKVMQQHNYQGGMSIITAHNEEQLNFVSQHLTLQIS